MTIFDGLDDDETGVDPDEGYSRLSHEVPGPGDEFPGDGIDGGAASTEEAAVHVVPDDEEG